MRKGDLQKMEKNVKDTARIYLSELRGFIDHLGRENIITIKTSSRVPYGTIKNKMVMEKSTSCVSASIRKGTWGKDKTAKYDMIIHWPTPEQPILVDDLGDGCEELFRGCVNLENIAGLFVLETPGIMNFFRMFDMCNKITDYTPINDYISESNGNIDANIGRMISALPDITITRDTAIISAGMDYDTKIGDVLNYYLQKPADDNVGKEIENNVVSPVLNRVIPGDKTLYLSEFSEFLDRIGRENIININSAKSFNMKNPTKYPTMNNTKSNCIVYFAPTNGNVNIYAGQKKDLSIRIIDDLDGKGCYNLFRGCVNMVSIKGLSTFDLGGITNCKGMFFDTSVTDMTPILNPLRDIYQFNENFEEECDRNVNLEDIWPRDLPETKIKIYEKRIKGNSTKSEFKREMVQSSDDTDIPKEKISDYSLKTSIIDFSSLFRIEELEPSYFQASVIATKFTTGTSRTLRGSGSTYDNAIFSLNLLLNASYDDLVREHVKLEKPEHPDTFSIIGNSLKEEDSTDTPLSVKNGSFYVGDFNTTIAMDNVVSDKKMLTMVSDELVRVSKELKSERDKSYIYDEWIKEIKREKLNLMVTNSNLVGMIEDLTRYCIFIRKTGKKLLGIIPEYRVEIYDTFDVHSFSVVNDDDGIEFHPIMAYTTFNKYYTSYEYINERCGIKSTNIEYAKTPEEVLSVVFSILTARANE